MQANIGLQPVIYLACCAQVCSYACGSCSTSGGNGGVGKRAARGLHARRTKLTALHRASERSVRNIWAYCLTHIGNRIPAPPPPPAARPWVWLPAQRPHLPGGGAAAGGGRRGRGVRALAVGQKLPRGAGEFGEYGATGRAGPAAV